MPTHIMLDPQEINELRTKMNEYAVFVDKTLQPELILAVAAREETELEIASYRELADKLTMILSDGPTTGKPLESLIDLGHEVAYCKAMIENRQQVFVHVGLGFHAEFSLEEAIDFCERRISFLETQLLSKRIEKAKRVASHLEASLVILHRLAMEIQDMEESKR